MKKIIAFAMSTMLAFSAVAIPASAEPSVTALSKLSSISAEQARPVSSEELAQVHQTYQSETFTIEETVTVEPKVTVPFIYTVDENDPKDAAATTPDPALQAEPPVLAQITGGTATLEYHEGYEYQISDGNTAASWQASNLFEALSPSQEYYARQRLAGRPETESEPLLIRTADRIPCSLTPAEPVPQMVITDQIILFWNEKYEYRLNDGSWQDDPYFFNLNPDTEYVVYQRIRETAEECASEATQLKIRTAKPVTHTTDENYDQVVKYIHDNGFQDDNGRTCVAYSVQADATNVYYFVLTDYSSHILCSTFSVSSDATYLAFDTSFELHKSNISMEPTCYLLLCYNNEWYETVDMEGLWMHKKNYTDFCFQNVPGSSDNMSNETVKQMFNNTMAMLCGFWDEVFYKDLGFGLRALGFSSYDGYGELCCDRYTNFHAGDIITLYGREPGCGTSGNEGYQYCSACNSCVYYGNYLAPTGEHQYDNACDPDCNICGECRRTQHRYSFACDVECDICGAVRTDPLASHTMGEDLVCTKCGYLGLLIGDASGDGKVNMGDVAKVYAHTRGTSLLTNDRALAAADTNGDGKINLGDTSRILAHITGKKLLW